MLNNATLIGRLGNDPEVRYMPNGGAVTNISLATDRRWKKKDTGEKITETEWHRVIFFNKLGEIAGKYLKKGALIYVEGRIKTRNWQDQSGQDRYSTEIIADQMQMLGSKDDNNGRQEDGKNSNTGGQQNYQAKPAQNTQDIHPQSSATDYEQFNDEIPF